VSGVTGTADKGKGSGWWEVYREQELTDIRARGYDIEEAASH
jgi:hypothetical protein